MYLKNDYEIIFYGPLNQWHWFKPVHQPNGENTKQEITMSDPIINQYPEIFKNTYIAGHQ